MIEGKFYEHPTHGLLRRGYISEEQLLQKLRQEVPHSREKTAQEEILRGMFERVVPGLLLHGGVITKNGQYLFDLGKWHYNQEILDKIDKAGFVEKTAAKVERDFGISYVDLDFNINPQEKVYLLRRNALGQIDYQRRQQGGILFFFQWPDGKKASLFGLEKALANVVKRQYDRYGVSSPLFKPATIASNALIEAVVFNNERQTSLF